VNKTQRVRLLKPHTHGGVTRPVGAELTLRPDQAKRLIDRGKAEAIDQSAAAKPGKES